MYLDVVPHVQAYGMPPSNKSRNCAKHSISTIRSTESEQGRKKMVRQPTRDLDEY